VLVILKLGNLEQPFLLPSVLISPSTAVEIGVRRRNCDSTYPSLSLENPRDFKCQFDVIWQQEQSVHP
jgi:hypothetical protein